MPRVTHKVMGSVPKVLASVLNNHNSHNNHSNVPKVGRPKRAIHDRKVIQHRILEVGRRVRVPATVGIDRRVKAAALAVDDHRVVLVAVLVVVDDHRVVPAVVLAVDDRKAVPAAGVVPSRAAKVDSVTAIKAVEDQIRAAVVTAIKVGVVVRSKVAVLVLRRRRLRAARYDRAVRSSLARR
jgi:hypothetical protein